MSSLKFRLKKIDETRNSHLDEIKHNDLKSGKHTKTCKYLNYVEHLLILVSTVTGCVSISGFALLVCVPGCQCKFCRGNQQKKKKKKKYDKIVLLGKDKYNMKDKYN